MLKTAKKISGVAIATAAAAAFTLAPMQAQAAAHGGAAPAMVNCMGVNSCKGHGDCATKTNECKGKNACKGKGMMSMTAADCDTKGGTHG